MQNPQQRNQKQFQKQMQDQRQKQLEAGWYADQQAKQGGSDAPPSPRSFGCMRFAATLIGSGLIYAILCGGVGYVVGRSMLDNETAILGAGAGLIVALGAAILTGVLVGRR